MIYSTHTGAYLEDLNAIVLKILTDYPNKRLAFYAGSLEFNKWSETLFPFKYSIIIADGIARPLLVLFSSFNRSNNTVYAVNFIKRIGQFQIMLIETAAQFKEVQLSPELLSFTKLNKQHREMFYNYVSEPVQRGIEDNIKLLEEVSNSLNSYTSRPCSSAFIEHNMLQKYVYKNIHTTIQTDEATHSHYRYPVKASGINSCILAKIQLQGATAVIEFYKNAYQKYTHQNIYTELKAILLAHIDNLKQVKHEILNYFYRLKLINKKHLGILTYLHFSVSQYKKNLHNQIIRTEHYQHCICSTILRIPITKYGLQDLRYSKYSSFVNWHNMVDLYHMHNIVIQINRYNTK